MAVLKPSKSKSDDSCYMLYITAFAIFNVIVFGLVISACICDYSETAQLELEKLMMEKLIIAEENIKIQYEKIHKIQSKNDELKTKLIISESVNKQKSFEIQNIQDEKSNREKFASIESQKKEIELLDLQNDLGKLERIINSIMSNHININRKKHFQRTGYGNQEFNLKNWIIFSFENRKLKITRFMGTDRDYGANGIGKIVESKEILEIIDVSSETAQMIITDEKGKNTTIGISKFSHWDRTVSVIHCMDSMWFIY